MKQEIIKDSLGEILETSYELSEAKRISELEKKRNKAKKKKGKKKRRRKS